MLPCIHNIYTHLQSNTVQPFKHKEISSLPALFMWLQLNTLTQQLRTGRTYLTASQLRPIISGESSQELRQARAARHECTHAASLLLLALSCLVQVRSLCLGSNATHKGLSLPMSIKNEDNSPHACPQTNLIWEVPQMRLSSWLLLGWVRSTVKAKEGSVLLDNRDGQENVTPSDVSTGWLLHTSDVLERRQVPVHTVCIDSLKCESILRVASSSQFKDLQELCSKTP